jgi:hypothetical protein
MKYLLLIYEDEKAWARVAGGERQTIFGEYMQLTEDMKKNGQYQGGNPLQPTSAATTVRVRDGKRLVTDGPFAETKEQLGGYYLIDAADLDAALNVAARIPAVRGGSIEVRPIMEM